MYYQIIVNQIIIIFSLVVAGAALSHIFIEACKDIV